MSIIAQHICSLAHQYNIQTQPWVLSALYTGNVFIWDYSSGVRTAYLHAFPPSLRPTPSLCAYLSNPFWPSLDLCSNLPSFFAPACRTWSCWLTAHAPPSLPPSLPFFPPPLQAMVKSFEVCDLPVRSAKFIVRKSWFIAASDDMFLRVYNYNTMEKVKAWEAHMDYIR